MKVDLVVEVEVMEAMFLKKFGRNWLTFEIRGLKKIRGEGSMLIYVRSVWRKGLEGNGLDNRNIHSREREIKEEISNTLSKRRWHFLLRLT